MRLHGRIHVCNTASVLCYLVHTSRNGCLAPCVARGCVRALRVRVGVSSPLGYYVRVSRMFFCHICNMLRLYCGLCVHALCAARSYAVYIFVCTLRQVLFPEPSILRRATIVHAIAIASFC